MTTPSTRYGQPSDIAGLVTMLMSDDGEFINGQLLDVDRGLQFR